MAKKDIKLDEGIRNISFDVTASDISVYSERVDVPVVRYSDNFEVQTNGRETIIKEKGNGRNSNVIVHGRGNCSITIGNNVISSGTIIASNSGVVIINGQVYGKNDGNSLNGEYSSVELVLPKYKDDYSINVQSKSGDLDIEDTILAKLIANTISGDITLKDIDTMFMKLKTVSGDIKATILESIINYRMALKTVSGYTSQDNFERVSPTILQIKHEIEAETVSGDISLTFKGKR